MGKLSNQTERETAGPANKASCLRAPGFKCFIVLEEGFILKGKDQETMAYSRTVQYVSDVRLL